MSRAPGADRPAAFASVIDGLRDALRANPCPPEPAHVRERRIAMSEAGFCADVLAAWHAQALHRGHRARYGLTERHAEHAAKVQRWALWRADVAAWVERIGPEQAASAEGRPEPPPGDPPEADQAPRGWPPDPARPGAVGDFFSAISGG